MTSVYNNKYKAIIWGVLITLTIVLLSCLIVFWHAGYSIAWNSPIDMGVTQVFATMMASFIAGISTVLMLVTIRQQNYQFFEREFSGRLKTQREIKAELQGKANIIFQSDRPQKCDLAGEKVFEAMCWQLTYLFKAKKGVYYSWIRDWENYQQDMACVIITELGISEQKQIAEYSEKMRTSFVLQDYGQQGCFNLSWEETCNLVFNRWLPILTVYYRHLLNTLDYLDKQCDKWSIGNDIKEACLNELVANLSKNEQTILFYYFATHRSYKTLQVHKNVLFCDVRLLEESHKDIITI